MKIKIVIKNDEWEDFETNEIIPPNKFVKKIDATDNGHDTESIER